jgi:hypothetical protein
MMPEAEYQPFKANIASQGLSDPIWTYQGKVLDGRNRLRACEELGIEPVTREWDGPGTPEEFVVTQNWYRRHLTSDQRKAIAAEVATRLSAEEGRKRQSEGGKSAGRGRPANSDEQVVADSPQPNEDCKSAAKSREKAATPLNVSPRGVQDAIKVLREDRELHEKVKSGEMKLSQALRRLAQAKKSADQEPAADQQPAAEEVEASPGGDPDGTLKRDETPRPTRHPNLRDQLRDPFLFDVEEQLWREIQPAIDTIQAAVKVAEKQIRDGKAEPGKHQYLSQTKRTLARLKSPSPKDWILCPECQGKKGRHRTAVGENDSTLGECQGCENRGYMVRELRRRAPTRWARLQKQYMQGQADVTPPSSEGTTPGPS